MISWNGSGGGGIPFHWEKDFVINLPLHPELQQFSIPIKHCQSVQFLVDLCFFLFSLNSNSNSPHLKLTFYLILYKGHSTRSLFILIIGNWKYRNLALQQRNYKFLMSIFLKRWSIFWFSNFLIRNLLRDLPWGENRKSWCINMYGFSHTLIINWACSKANFVAKLI